MEGFGEIMTFEETTKYLKIKLGKSTLYKMAREDKTPTVKVANQWRFKREDIDKWLQEMRNKEILSNKENEFTLFYSFLEAKSLEGGNFLVFMKMRDSFIYGAILGILSILFLMKVNLEKIKVKRRDGNY